MQKGNGPTLRRCLGKWTTGRGGARRASLCTPPEAPKPIGRRRANDVIRKQPTSGYTDERNIFSTQSDLTEVILGEPF